MLILQFAIPLVIITFCYSMISLQLSKVNDKLKYDFLKIINDILKFQGLMYRNRRDEEIPLSGIKII